MTDADICPVDFAVKSTLVRDTIKLVKKNRQTVVDLDSFNSLTKIHPDGIEQRDGATDIYSLVRQMRTIFYAITPIKNKEFCTAQMFEKLF